MPKRRYSRKKSQPKWLSKRAPVPTKFATKMRYYSTFSLNPGAGGVPSTYVFSANGVADPDVTGGGHQPRGFDQLMALYDHCTVVGSKITVRAAQITSNEPVILAVNMLDSTTTGNLNFHMENGYTKSKLLGANNSTEPATIIMSQNPNKYLGRSKPLSDPELKNSSTGNPTEQAFWHVTAAPTSTADVSAVYGDALIEYSVVFHEPKNPAQS